MFSGMQSFLVANTVKMATYVKHYLINDKLNDELTLTIFFLNSSGIAEEYDIRGFPTLKL